MVTVELDKTPNNVTICVWGEKDDDDDDVGARTHYRRHMCTCGFLFANTAAKAVTAKVPRIILQQVFSFMYSQNFNGLLFSSWTEMRKYGCHLFSSWKRTKIWKLKIQPGEDLFHVLEWVKTCPSWLLRLRKSSLSKSKWNSFSPDCLYLSLRLVNCSLQVSCSAPSRTCSNLQFEPPFMFEPPIASQCVKQRCKVEASCRWIITMFSLGTIKSDSLGKEERVWSAAAFKQHIPRSGSVSAEVRRQLGEAARPACCWCGLNIWIKHLRVGCVHTWKSYQGQAE